MKYLFILGFFLLYLNATTQTLDTFQLVDHLVEAINPDCEEANNTYVNSFPNDSSWVNFFDGGTMTGTFGCQWQDGDGFDIILETSYHPDNYHVRLKLQDGSFSGTRIVSDQEWTDLSGGFYEYVGQGSCSYSFWDGSQHILPLDFIEDFGLTENDIVEGIEIIFKDTPGSPDLAGVYISEFAVPSNGSELGLDTIICSDAFLPLSPGNFMEYLWSDGSTESTLVFDAAAYGLGEHEISVEACWENCCIEDVIIITVEVCSSIEDKLKLDDLKIYPNPFHDYLKIELTKSGAETPYSVLNLQGQEIQTGTISSGNYTLETSEWPRGIYAIQVGGQFQKIIKE